LSNWDLYLLSIDGRLKYPMTGVIIINNINLIAIVLLNLPLNI